MSPQFIHLIVEGSEEEYFFEIVKEFGVSNKFALTIENAKTSGNVSPLLEEYFQLYQNDFVFAVYDVDGKTQDGSPFSNVQQSLLDFFGDKDQVDAVSLCTNPNILQLFLLGCDCLNNVALKTSSKANNTDIVHKYWPDIGKTIKGKNNQLVKKNYDAKKWQLEIMKNSYICRQYNYDTLLRNAKALPTNFSTNIPGSNLYPFLKALKEGDESYFDNYRKIVCE